MYISFTDDDEVWKSRKSRQFWARYVTKRMEIQSIQSSCDPGDEQLHMSVNSAHRSDLLLTKRVPAAKDRHTVTVPLKVANSSTVGIVQLALLMRNPYVTANDIVAVLETVYASWYLHYPKATTPCGKDLAACNARQGMSLASLLISSSKPASRSFTQPRPSDRDDRLSTSGFKQIILRVLQEW